METSSTSSPKSSNKLNVSLALDLRIVVVILALIIVGMIALWKPWNTAPTNARTVQVTGETTIKSEPDQYTFNPSYQFKNQDKTAGNAAASAKSNEVVIAIKKLGVAEKDIKTNITSYDDYTRSGAASGDYVFALTVTIVIAKKDLAQTIQNYLITTNPQGTITPVAGFSEAKRKLLESQARDEATKDARAKAEQSAKNLGFKIGAVKTVSDGSGFSTGPMPYAADGAASTSELKAIASSAPIQVGENELPYSITVTYYLK